MENINKMAAVFGSIFQLSNKLQTLGDKIDDYMSMKQWMLIAAISKSEKNALNIRELAEIIGTSYQNVKKMAVILEKQGYLALQKNPADARAILISLTAKCKEYFAQRADVEKAFLQSVFEELDEKAITDLYHGIVRLHESVNKKLKKSEGNEA
jgi:DNA-binding MarR family transcriptional regulator